MNTLLETLYNLLSFITEDGIAHGITKNMPDSMKYAMENLMKELERHLD